MPVRRILLLLGLAAVVALPIIGCSTIRQAAFAVRSGLREGTDYGRLEADREAEAGGVPAGVAFDEAAPAAYWTDFRGPARDGTYTEQDLALPWPEEGPPLAWRRPIGGGMGSFVVAGGLAFTLEQRLSEEALVAYDLDTGAQAWLHAWEARFDEMLSGEGPRATPTYADGHVYALGAAGELRCVRAADGSLVWRRDVLEEIGAENLEYGLAGSPLVVDDLLIVPSGGPAILAFDRTDGAQRWSALEEHCSYAAPVRATLAGRDQVVVVTSERVAGLDPEGGAVLWTYPWSFKGPACCEAFPVGAEDLLVSAGYGQGTVRIRLTAGADGFEAEGLWRSRRLRTRFNATVVHEDHVYGFDEGMLVCLDFEDGRRVWRGERYGYGQVLRVGEHLIVTTEEGGVALVRASPERFEELGFVEAVDGMTMNVPALAHGRLLVRNDREMACFDLR